MTVTFHLRDANSPVVPHAQLPPALEMACWTPREQRIPPPPWPEPLRLAVWVQDRLRMFGDGRFTELSLFAGDARVHRLIVTPRWYRFPFMRDGDLQLGALWTDPQWRRRGLARGTMAHAIRIFDSPGQRFWYVTDDTNTASAALAASLGFRWAGIGRRTRPAGIAALGQFRLDRPCRSASSDEPLSVS